MVPLTASSEPLSDTGANEKEAAGSCTNGITKYQPWVSEAASSPRSETLLQSTKIANVWFDTTAMHYFCSATHDLHRGPRGCAMVVGQRGNSTKDSRLEMMPRNAGGRDHDDFGLIIERRVSLGRRKQVRPRTLPPCRPVQPQRTGRPIEMRDQASLSIQPSSMHSSPLPRHGPWGVLWVEASFGNLDVSTARLCPVGRGRLTNDAIFGQSPHARL
jgi:hypothetical protein